LTKKQLRKKYKELRLKLSIEEIDEASIHIANQLLNIPIWSHNYYHTFLPIEEQKEVNTEYLLNILAGKDKNIIISKSNFENFSMSHYVLTDNTLLKKNQYNIPEPVNGIPVETKLIDVVFVPLLAYDLKGNRIGYGKGFYDRFLALCKPETLKIGLSFFEPESETITTSEKDIILDYCITQNNIYTFTK